MGPRHRMFHHAGNPLLRGEHLLPTRRGRFGVLIPTLILTAAVFALVVWLSS